MNIFSLVVHSIIFLLYSYNKIKKPKLKSNTYTLAISKFHINLGLALIISHNPLSRYIIYRIIISHGVKVVNI